MSFSATLKPKEVETPLDLWFFRPLAYLVVRLVWPTPISANQLTGMSLVTGVFASLCFLSTSPEWVRAGVGLMLFYAVLDCADGQLARARGTSSRFGRILDGSSDYLVGVLSTATLGWHLWQLHGLWGVVSVGVGMSAFGIQAVAYDGYKNRFLALSASQVREGEDLEEARADLAQSRSFIERAALWAYVLFLQAQGVRPRPKESAEPARMAPLVRASAWLGPSTHTFLLCAAALSGQLLPYFVLRTALGSLVLLVIALMWRSRAAA